jgi:hypothetical protein
MKNPLKFIALFAAAAVPSALAAEIAGINLPPGFDLGSAFVLFVCSAVALIAVTDYTRTLQPRAVAKLGTAKAAHPLAA